jgi:amino acid adenylation domain-containing protein
MMHPRNNPGSVNHGNFANLLWRAGETFGGRVAMQERDVATGYAEVLARAHAVARALDAAGIAPGDRVAVLLHRGPDAAASLFAVLAVGGVVVPVNQLYQPRQIEYVLRHSGCRALVSSAALLSELTRPLQVDVPIMDVADLSATGTYEPLVRSPEDPAQIIYTSGSTGQPKGVLASHRNLWAGVHTVLAYLPIRDDDRIASVLPFSFVYGFNQLTCALATGAMLVIERATLATELTNWLRRLEATVLAAVPPLWMQLLGTAGFRQEPLASLRIMTNAGGRLPPNSVKELRKAQPQADLYLMYGLTEVFRSTYLPADQADRHPDSMGRAVPGAEVYVAREDGSEADVGEVGELVHAGPTVAIGYWNDPEASARVFRQNPFRNGGPPGQERVVFSGDLVRKDAEGLLYYVSRRDRMIKSLGYRVSPDEIADVLLASGEVLEGVVVGEPDPQRGERIVAHVVLRPTGSLDQLRQFCAVELPRYMWPTRFEVRDAIPRTAAGKFDYRSLQPPPPAASQS